MKYLSYESLIADARYFVENPGNEFLDGEIFSSIFYLDSSSYQTLGYLQRDLDGNGVEELLFEENGEDGWNGILFNMYTILDGEIVRVFDGWERSRYYLCENGCIANEWDNSGFEWGIDYYTYQGTEITLIISLRFDSYSDGDAWSYSTEPGHDWETYEPMTAEQAYEIRGQYVYEIPQFIPFVGQ